MKSLLSFAQKLEYSVLSAVERIMKTYTAKDYTKACQEANFKSMDFEHALLNSGREFLPRCARRVLNGKPASSNYWKFLCDEVAECQNEEES